jgi:hypothetical protein
MDPGLTAALDILAPLREAWPSSGWTWDGRFECTTSPFPVAQAAAVRASVLAVLPAEWTLESILSAPPEVGALARRVGGLRSGQFLFTGGGAGATIVPFALWWPWGNGETISVRLGVHVAERPPELSTELRTRFIIS